MAIIFMKKFAGDLGGGFFKIENFAGVLGGFPIYILLPATNCVEG